MKPSGIEWIGDIPDDWKIVKTGRIFHNIKEIVRENSASIERLALTLNGVIKRRKDDAEGLQPQQFDGYQYLRKNQLVFKLIDLENINTSRVGLCPFEEGMVSPAYIVLQNYSIDNRFYHYYFLSLWHNEIFNHLGGDGVRSALNAKDLLNIPTFDIPHQTQQKIADYLDEKCGEIDKTIEKQKESIEKLKAYKQSLISETVTKGLNKSTPLKPSGIDYLGDIPTHWEVKKLKTLLKESLTYGANESGILFDENKPRYIRITDIKDEQSLRDDSPQSLPEDKAKDYILQNDDILLARSGATVGKTFIYKSDFGRCAFAGYLIRARMDVIQMLPKFFIYYSLSSCYFEWKSRIFIQATIQNIGANKYNNMEIPIPPISKQKEILMFLNGKCDEIDLTINKKQNLIEKLDAYKKSLIFECVTGKRTIF